VRHWGQKVIRFDEPEESDQSYSAQSLGISIKQQKQGSLAPVLD